MVCFAVPRLEVLHQAMENHQRSLEPSGLVGESADQCDRPTLPLASLGPFLLGLLRGVAGEVAVTEKASS